ncbi:sensor histidine kinase [Bradyrhizobium sp. TM239]|uniref:sensor histidine kinase n=1 Tax=Bradyrhizobium sp. TM239 TaxID=2599802 RepID=UPI0027D6F2EA|nr:ATP-binding protein [Bradyrhizobium sp. TM239]
MRIVKVHVSPASESHRTSLGNWLQTGSEQSIEALYWTFSADLLFVVRPSPEGRFVYQAINPEFGSRLGLSPEDVYDMDVFDCMNADDARIVCQALGACVAEGAEIRIRQRLAFGGSPRNVETVVIPVVQSSHGGAVRLIGSHRPLRNRAFESGGGPDNRLGVNLGLIQEGIQQRIASDLHDSTCQHLIAASLGLMRIRSSIGKSDLAEQLCDEIDGSIDEALREIRAFAYLLHPRNLAGEGLKAAIERYAEGFAARTSLRASVDIVPDVDRLPYETKRTLLRVVQEALTNVFRHANATEVAIVIDTADGRFHLTLSDNGRGLPPGFGRSAVSVGVGIPAMQARLHEIGGTLDIQSSRAPRHTGTVLCAVFPYAPSADRANRRGATTSARARAGAQSAKKH